MPSHWVQVVVLFVDFSSFELIALNNECPISFAVRRENVDLLLEKGHADYDAFNLALEFVGMRGGCNEVAQAFINAYFNEGYNVFDTYDVTYEEAKPGDIIYYANGGEVLQHYAVYLGGASALQGNINGTTVIGSVYMTNGSLPQFKRLNGLE